MSPTNRHTLSLGTRPAPVLLADLAANGLRPGPPESLEDWALAIDVRTCAEAPCENCGHQGLACLPLCGRGDAYAVLAVCPACGAASEF